MNLLSNYLQLKYKFIGIMESIFFNEKKNFNRIFNLDMISTKYCEFLKIFKKCKIFSTETKI
jgi:hypothetical protein